MRPNGEAAVIRTLLVADLPGVVGIQAASYPLSLREGRDALASRITLPSSYCLAATWGGVLQGYLLAHGWTSESPPAFGSALASEGIGSEVLYIHDLAVAASGGGVRLGRELVARAVASSRSQGLRRAELIAVDGAVGYWLKAGFTKSPAPPNVARKLPSYGPRSSWMTMEL